MRRKHFRLFLIVIVVLLIAVSGWAVLFRTITHTDIVLIERGDIESSVTALGTLQPHNYVDVGAQASGAIRRIHIQVGDHVKKGQLLVDIDPSVQQAKVDVDRSALASLRAQYAAQLAQSTLARQRDARERQMGAEGASRAEDLQTAHANLITARATVAEIKAQIDGAQFTLQGDEAQLGYTRIFAPMDGTVVTLDAREGQTLNATYQTPIIMRIADLSTMTVWTQVSEADVSRVKAGMPVYFTTLGMDSHRWQSQVRQILPAPPHTGKEAGGTIDSTSPAPTSGKVVLYTALFDIDNHDGMLMSQMSAQVFFIESRAKNVVVAPLSALTALAPHPGIYEASVLVDGKPIKREVRIGVRNRLQAEVLSGLSVGDGLITGIHDSRLSDGKFEW